MSDLEKLHNSIRELEEQANQFKGFGSIISDLNTIKNASIEAIETNNQKFDVTSSDIRTALDKAEKRNNEIATKQSERFEEFYRDNKNFQKELDSSLVSRLGKLKSDIQIEIRNECEHTKQALGTLIKTGFDAVETKADERFDQVSKKAKTLKIILLVVFALNIGIAVGLFLDFSVFSGTKS